MKQTILLLHGIMGFKTVITLYPKQQNKSSEHLWRGFCTVSAFILTG